MKLGSSFNVRYSSGNDNCTESIRIEANDATDTESTEITTTSNNPLTNSSENLVDSGSVALVTSGDDQRWKPLRTFWNRLQKATKTSSGSSAAAAAAVAGVDSVLPDNEPLLTSQSLPSSLLTGSHVPAVTTSRSDLDLQLQNRSIVADSNPTIDLQEFEDIESAVDCLEEMPDISYESVPDDDDNNRTENNDFVFVNGRHANARSDKRAATTSKICDKQFAYNFWFRFFRRHSSILKHIFVGIGLSIAAYVSLVFVFGIFAGIVFLVVFGPTYFYADHVRARYEKRTSAMKRQFAAWSNTNNNNNNVRTFETWLRLYPELNYDPSTYHVSRTLSIFVKLHGSKLAVAFTPYRMSTKMMSSNMAQKLQSRRVFCHQRQLDLRSYDIFLLPNSLKSERIWNKKYPICLRKKQTVTSHVDDNFFDIIDENVDLRAHKSEHSIVDLEEDDLGIYHYDHDPQNHEKLVYETLQQKIDEIDGICASSTNGSRKPIKCHHSTYHKTNTAIFFVFAKTNREKESLYRKFLQASACSQTSQPSSLVTTPSTTATAQPKTSKPAFFDTFLTQTNRWRYSPNDEDGDEDNENEINSTDSNEIDDFIGIGGVTNNSNSDVAWLNAIMARLFYQFVNDTQWITIFEHIIQKKLDALKMVSFMDDIRISGLNFGPCAPRLTGVHKPLVDDDGLWLDFAVDYSGFISFTLATKLNLIRGLSNMSGRKDDCNLSQTDGMEKFESDSSLSNENSLTNMTILADDDDGNGVGDDNDSVESSSDDDFPDFPVTSNPNFAQTAPSPTRSRRFIDFMDKVTASKYFQNAKEYKYVRRAIDGLANTELKLEISLMKLTGVLVLHIPNPIANRVWYGFRENPELVLSAKPAVGERAINIFQITSWIEKRLCQEFQKYFVLPNMEDLEVPFLDLEKFPALFEC